MAFPRLSLIHFSDIGITDQQLHICYLCPALIDHFDSVKATTIYTPVQGLFQKNVTCKLFVMS